LPKGFFALHPFTAALYFLFAVVIPFAFLTPAAIVPGAVMSCVLLFSQYGFAKTKSGMFFSLGFLAVIFIANIAFSQNGQTVLFWIGYRPITLENLVFSLLTALMFFSVITWFALFSRVFDSDRLLFLLTPLSKTLALLVSMTLLRIPLLYERQKTIGQMRSFFVTPVKGNRAKRLFVRLKRLLGVFTALLVWTMEESVETADSMAARGFGVGKRSSYRRWRITARDMGCIAVILGLGAAFILWESLAGTFSIFPKLTVGTFTPAGAAFTLCYLCLLSLPLIEH